MKGINTWSYSPYKPLMTNVGDIYICQIVPFENKIHFEWLNTDAKEYSVTEVKIHFYAPEKQISVNLI